ncbi:sel1 repeat family protein [Streptomyces sp. YIM 121038]|uniref:tetratricopeptide repeat protein n=1 Tax=Streptomyces sp. YIM 121038 TaxID=2136401 RepID=UPI001110A366|nr:sel1 repeat family protein [Streptomyces sp. YIM 121038]
MFARLRRVGALKRGRLDGDPSDRRLARAAGVSHGTPGAWLDGRQLPQRIDPLLAVLDEIRTEAARRGLLATRADALGADTVGELLDERRWRAAFEAERGHRNERSRLEAERQRARAALERDGLRARQAALADRPRPVRQWPAGRLGVHPAIPGRTPVPGRAPIPGPGHSSAPAADPTHAHAHAHAHAHGNSPTAAEDSGFVLPRYVPRPHDVRLRRLLAPAVTDGAPPILVVVQGPSCAGKTRTAYEALQVAVPAGFDLLFPADTDSLLATLAADALPPRTVLWLNEAQHHLTDPQGEAAAAALLRRLDGEGPLVVIATLWPEHAEALTRPASHSGDAHRHARALLSQAHWVDLSRTFASDLDAARAAAAEDASLAEAVAAGAAELTQVLAAGPDLVRHYERAAGPHGPYGSALISAAMDAHRLGGVGALPLAFLEAAAVGYLTDAERAAARPDWFGHALARARTLIKHTTSPLQDVPHPTGMGRLPGTARLADYLQHHGRHARRFHCPPDSFWRAAREHLTHPEELLRLGDAARWRARYAHAVRLYSAAADAGESYALIRLGQMREDNLDMEEAQRLYRLAVDAGNTDGLLCLAALWEDAWCWEEAEELYLRASAAGVEDALAYAGLMWDGAGEPAKAWATYERALRSGHTDVLIFMAQSRRREGAPEQAAELYRRAADAGHTDALHQLVCLWEETGQQEEADRQLRRFAEDGDTSALLNVAHMLGESGQPERAERLYLRAASAGDDRGWYLRAFMWEKAGGRAKAESSFRAAVESGDLAALLQLARSREAGGDITGAEALYRQAVDAEADSEAMLCLARLQEAAGDRERAERLYLMAADTGDVRVASAVLALARLRGAEEEAYLRFGLAADGSASDPWEWPLTPEPVPAASVRAAVTDHPAPRCD